MKKMETKQTYEVRQELQHNYSDEQAAIFDNLKQAVEGADLMLGGTPAKPRILRHSSITGEEWKPSQFKERIYDLGADLSLEKYDDLTSKLTRSYGREFVSSLSPDFRKLQAKEQAKLDRGVEKGFLEETPILGEAIAPAVYNGKIVGELREIEGYDYQLTAKGERWLRKNPDKNPWVRELTGFSTPLDEERKARWMKPLAWLGGTAMLAAGGAGIIGAYKASRDAEELNENPAVFHQSSMPYTNGNPEDGMPHQLILTHRNTNSTNDDRLSVLLASEWDESTGETEYNLFTLRNGSKLDGKSMTSEDMYWALVQDCYPWAEELQDADWKCMVKIRDTDNNGQYDSITSLGKFPFHTEYQAEHAVPVSGKVQGGVLTIDGQTVDVEAVGYNPVKPGKGPWHEWAEDTEGAERDMQTLSDRGANFVYLEIPQNRENALRVLDNVENSGTKAMLVMSPDWPVDYSDPAMQSSIENRSLDRADAVKDSTGLAFYVLENEFGGNLSAFYNFVNMQAQSLEQIDANHDVIATVAEADMESADQNLTEVEALAVRVNQYTNLNDVAIRAANLSKPVLLVYEIPSTSNETAQAESLETFFQTYDSLRSSFAGAVVDGMMDQHYLNTPNGPATVLRTTVGDANLDAGDETGLYRWAQDGTPEPKEALTELIKAYDQEAPQLLSATPADGANLSADNVTVNVSVSDPNLAELLVDFYNATDAFMQRNATGDTNLSATLENLVSGENYRFELIARDIAGNELRLNRTFEVYQNNETGNVTLEDTIAPTIAFGNITPGNNTNVTDRKVPWDLTFGDDLGPLEIIVQLSDSNLTELNSTRFENVTNLSGVLQGEFNDVDYNMTVLLRAVISDTNQTTPTENRVIYSVFPGTNGTGTNGSGGETPGNNGTPVTPTPDTEGYGLIEKYWTLAKDLWPNALMIAIPAGAAAGLGYVYGRGSNEDKEENKSDKKAERQAKREARAAEKARKRAEKKAENQAKAAGDAEKTKASRFKTLWGVFGSGNTQEQLATVQDEDPNEHLITDIVDRYIVE